MEVEILISSAAEHSSQDSSCASTATTESGAAHPPTALVAISDNGLTSQPASLKPSLSSRFKGVVRQPKGRWGSARVWLGTFADEDAAARVYEVAALRFRGRDTPTNFRGSAEPAELAFLAGHSKAEIVDMLRNHTYADELRQGLRLGTGGRAQSTPSWARKHLFEKAVTLSDVGKLNRLVVPKQHAEKHFPLKCTRNTATTTGKGVLLGFEDGEGKVWRFRYSYWDSTQSYVLTKGWSRFVREKGLVAGDAVVFSCSTYGAEKQLFIDCKKVTTTADSDAASSSLDVTTKGEDGRVLRLFGVDIAQGKRGPATAAVGAQGSQELFKMQCVADGQHSAFIL